MWQRFLRSCGWGLALTLISLVPAELHRFFFIRRGIEVTEPAYVGLIIISWMAALYFGRRFGTLPRRENKVSLLTWLLLVVSPVLGGGYLAYRELIPINSLIGILFLVNVVIGYNMTVIRDKILSGKVPLD